MSTLDNMNPQDLRGQIAMDLNERLVQFRDPKIGLRKMSEGIGVHAKTLKRLMARENTPAYFTLYKIYRYLYQTSDDLKLIQLVPEVIRLELVNSTPKDFENTQVIFDIDVEKEILNDRIFCELYYLSATGALTEELIQFKYGMDGLQVLERMVEKKVLLRNKHQIQRGNIRTNLSPTTIKKVALNILDKFLKPENCDAKGNNFIGFYVEGLTPEGLNEWLKIDQEAFDKKRKIPKKYISEDGVRAWTIMATDTFLDRHSGNGETLQ